MGGFLGAMEGLGTGISQVGDAWMKEAKDQRVMERKESMRIKEEERAETRKVGAEKRAEERGLAKEERAEERLLAKEEREETRGLAKEERTEKRGRRTLREQTAQKKELAKYKTELEKIGKSDALESAKGGDYVRLYQTALSNYNVEEGEDMVTWLKRMGVGERGVAAASGAAQVRAPAAQTPAAQTLTRGTPAPQRGQPFRPGEGDTVRGPDGKLYIVTDGRPVPLDERPQRGGSTRRARRLQQSQ